MVVWEGERQREWREGGREGGSKRGMEGQRKVGRVGNREGEKLINQMDASPLYNH